MIKKSQNSEKPENMIRAMIHMGDLGYDLNSNYGLDGLKFLNDM